MLQGRIICVAEAFLHLKSELVEEVVDEVFNKADDAAVQMLPRDVMEDNAGSRSRQLVSQSEVLLVSINGHLEC